MARKGAIERKTKETDIRVSVVLDGTGKAEVQTGSGFFDHMLDHLARHSGMDINVAAKGDLHIDDHHTVEDVGICLGKALLAAVGDGRGINRYGSALIPMDEALAEAAVDFSGRPYLVFNASMPAEKIGQFDTELAEEFFRALVMNSRMTVHLNLRYGSNAHHCVEGLFKAFARALGQALRCDSGRDEVPSTKGMLET